MAESNEMKAKHDPLLPSNYFASTLQNADGTVNMRSLTHFTHEKAGMANVDKAHINKVVYEMSKNSAYFKNEQRKSDQLTKRIEELKAKIASINRQAELPSYALFEAEAARVINARLSALVADRDLSRVFIHVDLDMFYAAVEILDKPWLETQPMAVGGTSMLSTANYVARKFGVRSAMPGFIAKKLCPELVIVKPNYAKYAAVGETVRDILRGFDPNFQSHSLDEARLEVTEYLARPALQDSAVARTGAAVASEIRARIFASTKLTASAGVAPTGMLAKICSDMNKPNGQFVLAGDHSAVLAFMDSLPVRKIPGVGKVMERTLEEIGVRLCGQLRDPAMRLVLKQLFSAGTFDWLLLASLGGPVHDPGTHEDAGGLDRKSVSTERTFPALHTVKELRAKCSEIARALSEDLQACGVEGKTLTLKLKMTDFSVLSRAHTSVQPLRRFEELEAAALTLLMRELREAARSRAPGPLATKRTIGDPAANQPGVALDAGGLQGSSCQAASGWQTLDGALQVRLLGLRLSALRSLTAAVIPAVFKRLAAPSTDAGPTGRAELTADTEAADNTDAGRARLLSFRSSSSSSASSPLSLPSSSPAALSASQSVSFAAPSAPAATDRALAPSQIGPVPSSRGSISTSINGNRGMSAGIAAFLRPAACVNPFPPPVTLLVTHTAAPGNLVIDPTAPAPVRNTHAERHIKRIAEGEAHAHSEPSACVGPAMAEARTSCGECGHARELEEWFGLSKSAVPEDTRAGSVAGNAHRHSAEPARTPHNTHDNAASPTCPVCGRAVTGNSLSSCVGTDGDNATFNRHLDACLTIGTDASERHPSSSAGRNAKRARPAEKEAQPGGRGSGATRGRAGGQASILQFLPHEACHEPGHMEGRPPKMKRRQQLD